MDCDGCHNALKDEDLVMAGVEKIPQGPERTLVTLGKRVAHQQRCWPPSSAVHERLWGPSQFKYLPDEYKDEPAADTTKPG